MAYDPEKLDDIYDGGEGEGDPKPKPNKAVPLGALDTAPSPVAFGTTTNTNIADNIDYMPEGVYSNQDLELVKGYRQSVPAKIGLRLANAVPNMLGSVLQMIGYTGALATEWGDQRDYSNAFTQAGEAIQNPFGQTFRRSHDTFALGDPTWWIDNVANLAEIAVPFAGEAKVASMGMEAVAKGAANLFKLGEQGTRIAQGIGQLATAGFSAYTEEAMDGASVYDEVYKNQYSKQLYKGLSPEEAHKEAQHIAAQSAATTVQIGTAMTTLLNLSSVAPFFKQSDETVKDVLRNQLAHRVDETTAEWAARIRNLKAEDFPAILGKHGAAKFLQEMAQEGIEEVEQQFAQKTGQQEGTEGRTHGLLEQLSQFENFFDRTMDKDGALAFVLGAAGGGLQTAIMENAPTQRSTIDQAGNNLPQAVNSDGTLKWENGNPVMQTIRVSPKTYDEWSTRKTFNNARDVVAEDVTNFAKMQDDYLTAVKNKDTVAISKAQNAMFNVAQMNAVTSGMVEPWTNTFKQIAQLDNTQTLNPDDENGPTEAMQRGYAVDRTDGEYKAKANEAIEDLHKYAEEYAKLQKRYGTTYEANEGIKNLVDMMFYRKVDLMTNEKLIKRHEEELFKMEDEEKSIIQAADPESFNSSVQGYHNQIQSAKEVFRQLKSDHDKLVKAVDSKEYSKIKPLLRKYRAVGANDTDMQAGVNDLVAKINRHMELQSSKAKKAEEDLLNSSGYNDWLSNHPEGTFEQYRKEVQKKYELNTTIPIYRTNIETFKAQHTIASANYADIHQETSIANFVKKATDWRTKLEKQTAELRAKQMADISMQAKDKATADRLNRIAIDGTAEQYRKLRDNAAQQLTDKQAELKDINAQLEGLSWIKDAVRKAGLQFRAKVLQSEIKKLQKQIKLYESVIKDYAVDTSTLDTDVPTNAITSDDTDLDKEEDDNPLPTPDLSTALVVDDTVVVPDTSAVVDDDEDDLSSYLNSDPLKQYQEDIQFLQAPVKQRLSEIEEGWTNGTLGFSRDLLNQQVKDKLIGPSRAVALLQQLWELVNDKSGIEDSVVPQDVVDTPEQQLRNIRNAIRKAVEPKLVLTDGSEVTARVESLSNLDNTIQSSNGIIDLNIVKQVIAQNDVHEYGTNKLLASKGEILYNRINTPVINAPTITLADIADPVDPITDNSDESVGTNFPVTGTRHAGLKTVDVISMANSTLLYEEDYIPKDNAYMKFGLNVIDPKSNPDLLTPNKLGANTKLSLVLDTDYDGTINIDDKLAQEDTGARSQRADKFANYLSDGTERREFSYDAVKVGDKVEIKYNWSDKFETVQIFAKSKDGRAWLMGESKEKADWKNLKNFIGDTLRFPKTAKTGKPSIKSDDASIGNVPIKIVDEAGKTVGYVRRLDWVTSKYPNTTDYRNIADTIFDADGNAIDNVEIQKQAILALRKQIVTQWNANKQPVEAKVVDKGAGQIILNRVPAATFGTKPKVEMKLARNDKNLDNSLLPDTSLKLGIVKAGTAYTSKDFPFSGKKGYETVDMKDGGIVVMLPGANGEHLYAPLIGQKLAERKTSIQTAARVIELYLLNDGVNKDVAKEIELIRTSTGHDVSNETGLRNFMSQYLTYTQSFDEAITAANAPSSGERKEKFLFNITNKAPNSTKAEIKIGWSFSGKPIAKATIVNGTLSPAFIAELTAGFGTRSRMVNYTDDTRTIKGINSTGAFKDAMHTASGWKFKEYPSYNEYVKSWSKTAVYGKNKLPNGKFVYTANPQIPFEVVKSNNPKLPVVEENTSPDTVNMPAPDLSTALPNDTPDPIVVPKPAIVVDNSKADAFDDLFNMSPDFSTSTVDEIGSASSGTKALTLTNLDTLYSQIPDMQRNGRTVQEVYDELVNRGHTFIPQGYNPFSLCM